MDPFWHVRLLYPNPTLFGLVDDVGNLILREHLGLEDGVVANLSDNAWLCLTLRLINRETYFLCERHCFPSMMNVSHTNGERLEIAPWYFRPSLIKHTIRAEGVKTLLREPSLWTIWGSSEMITGFLEEAIAAKNMIVVYGIIGISKFTFADAPERVEKWKSMLIIADVGDAFVTCYRKALGIRDDMPLILVSENITSQIVRCDAVCCFKQLLLEYETTPMTRLMFLSSITNCCFTDGIDTSPAARIREALADELFPRRGVKRAAVEIMDKEDEAEVSPHKRARIDTNE